MIRWLVFCEYGFSVFALWCPLATPTILLGFLLPWSWGISSRLLQQSAAIAPYLGRGVSPHRHPSWTSMWDSSSRPSCARNINNFRYADDITLMAECEEELKSLLIKVKAEWKSWLKAQHSENEDHGIRSHHFMGNRWGNSGNSVRLYFGGLQIHCRWWLQPWN